jgi:hypothetical protein
MPRPTGLKKTGGRKAGTPNQRSSDLKERIEELLDGDDLPGVIFSKIKKLPIDRQVEFLFSLMPYVYPKRKAVEIETGKGMTFADFIVALDDNDDSAQSTK